MAISEIRDNLILFKEATKSKIADSFFLRRRHPAHALAEKIAKRVGVKRIERIIDGKPKSYVIVADNLIIRIPLDKLTTARYRLNKMMLKDLARTKIRDFVPRFLGEGKIDNYTYFCEERLNGYALDVPISKMDEMVIKAAHFITAFHQETAKKVVLEEKTFRRLFSRPFNRLSKYLDNEYQAKLAKIEEEIKKQVLGKPFVTVWMHGDYKIENILFNTSNWKIEGIIDWDLSRISGLPLLDMFYLFLYKDNLKTKNGMSNIFKERFLKSNFSTKENEIIINYLKVLKLKEDFTRPLLIIFWIHHIAERYQGKLTNNSKIDKEWFKENIHSVIELISAEQKGKTYVR